MDFLFKHEEYSVDTILLQAGFEKIGEINLHFPTSLWWHSGKAIEISVYSLDGCHVVKGKKSYFLKAIGEEGELYSRDLKSFQDYLEAHFPQVHISFSFFRNTHRDSILKRILKKKFRISSNIDPVQIESFLQKLKIEFVKKSHKTRNIEKLSRMQGKDIGNKKSNRSFLDSFLQNEYLRTREEAEVLAEKLNQANEIKMEVKKYLDAYKKNSISAAVLFNYSSNIQVAVHKDDFNDALNSIIKEISDAHRYQINQKLFGGKLNIFIEEISHPEIAYQVEYCGGILNIHQLLSSIPADTLRKEMEQYLMVFPTRDIKVDGRIKDEKKLVASRMVRNFIQKLDLAKPKHDEVSLPKHGGWLGNVMEGNQLTKVPLFFPIKTLNTYESGTTGAGKSYSGRVYVENAILDGVSVLVLDPTRQWCGLALPNSNEQVISRFDDLGVKQNCVRGFKTRIYTPGFDAGLPIPNKIEELFKGTSVVSFKDLTDFDRCKMTRDILQTAYYWFNQEIDKTRLLLVFEETSTFLPENVSSDARNMAKEVRTLLSRITREKRKYGLALMFLTQSLSDFRMDGKVIREMVQNRFFLRATDNAELEYVGNYVSKEAKEIVKNLGVGEALVSSPFVSGVKFLVRPPFSAVRELNDDEIRKVNSNFATPENSDSPIKSEKNRIDREAQALEIIRNYYINSNKPIPAKELEKKLNIQGGSRQRLLDQLVDKKLIKIVKLKTTRGRAPYGIIPLH